MRNCRLIVDSAAGGPWNMAVDEALLLQAADERFGSLRFYRWSEPTLSLGYFQRHDDRRQHPASAGCAVVRRQTGGGAILHDRELTYSLALPAGNPLVRRSEQLYRIVHEAFVSALEPRLAAAGCECSLAIREAESALPPCEEPFLCFQRRARGDVLLTIAAKEKPGTARTLLPQPVPINGGEVVELHVGAVKILGSAQRRHRGALLQHGSLLLESSPAAPELPGWRDCTGLAISADQLIQAIAAEICQALNTRFVESPLPDPLRATARRLRVEKYESPEWTFRR
jgi:lipoate-protein ligase A